MLSKSNKRDIGKFFRAKAAQKCEHNRPKRGHTPFLRSQLVCIQTPETLNSLCFLLHRLTKPFEHEDPPVVDPHALSDRIPPLDGGVEDRHLFMNSGQTHKKTMQSIIGHTRSVYIVKTRTSAWL